MSLRKIALASDSRGLPLHPILHELWRTVEESGHVVVVELVTDKKRSSNVAGECSVEGLDTTGRSHTFKLTLFIATINRAYAQEQAPREGMEFVPFSGLTRRGRYAKVLGHELAHIAQAVRDPAYLRLLREICVEQRAIAVEVRRGGAPPSLSALQQRSDRIWPRVLESERPALAAEREIRRELLAGK